MLRSYEKSSETLLIARKLAITRVSSGFSPLLRRLASLDSQNDELTSFVVRCARSNACIYLAPASFALPFFSCSFCLLASDATATAELRIASISLNS